MRLGNIILILMITVGFVHADVRSNIAETKLTAQMQGSEGNKEIEINDFLKKIDSIGYSTVAANKNIQEHYFNKYKEKNIEFISFFTLVNKKKLRPLLLQNPDFGAYAPFNFLVYKTLDIENDNNTWYGHLDADTMLGIIGEEDPESQEVFKEMVDTFDAFVIKEMQPTKIRKFERTKSLPAITKLKMVKKFETPDDMEEFIEDFIMKHDSLFSKHDFTITGFIDFKFEYSNMDLEFDKYDAYWVSSLCHSEFSNSLFNHGIPEAGIFASCSVYFYIPKGSNELHVGYTTVDNWINTINMKDQARIDYMRTIDAEVVEIFKELGFEPVNQITAKGIDTSVSEIAGLKEKIKELDAELTIYKMSTPIVVPMVVNPRETKVVKLPKKMFTGARLVIGGEVPKDLSTYYVADPQTVEGLKEKLKTNGFTVLATTQILTGKTVITITNDELQKTNTLLATLQVLVNGENEVRVQNPSYFGAAYLQKNYKYGQFSATLKALQAALGDMYEVEDKYELDDLAGYHFMFGMPFLNDTIRVAEGENLLGKLAGEKAAKYVAYTLKLPNGATIVGHKLRSRTNTFLQKIEAEDTANILPYEVMIKEGKAVILDPKYYLALSLPLLSMSEFMKIASAPDEIEKDIKRAYN